MIFTYADLKGKIKVGDKVRAVKGKNNECGLLHDDGSNTETITKVSNNWFYINDCNHSYEEGGYLDLIDHQKTLDNLEVGDIVVNGGGERMVLGVCGRVYMMSFVDDFDMFSVGHTVQDLKENGYTIKSSTPSPKKMTLAEISVALGYEVEVVE